MLQQQLDDFLEELKKLPLTETEESFQDSHKLQDRLNSLYEETKKNPVVLSDRLVDSLEKIALSSPYSDIDDPSAEIHHRQTPAQDVCLCAVRLLDNLAFTHPEKSGDVILRLENIVQSSLDYDIRNDAIMSLWELCERQEPQKSCAVAALERQGMQNSNAYIRMAARDQLVMASHEQEDIIPRAINAQIKGTEDTDPDARVRALAMLKNRAISSTCTDEEARGLLAVFEKVAADTRPANEQVAYWIERGIAETKKRLKEGPTPYSFP